jgi:hypothetical protein
VKPAYRLGLLMVSAFGLGLLAGNGVNLRSSVAQSFLAPEPGKSADQKPRGYKGVIPGYLPPEAQDQAQAPNKAPDDTTSRTASAPPTENSVIAPGATPATQTAEMSVDPGYLPPRQITSVDDIRMAALEKPLHIDWEHIQMPPQVLQSIKQMLTQDSQFTLSTPLFRIEGMLPEEFSTKRQIDSIMAAINNPNLPSQDRKASARKAADNLRGYANTLQVRKEIPDTMFRQMGVPEIYLKEEQETVNNSLTRVEDAIKELRKYE